MRHYLLKLTDRLRSEQAPRSGFHPHDESTTINCGFWDLVGAIEK